MNPRARALALVFGDTRQRLREPSCSLLRENRGGEERLRATPQESRFPALDVQPFRCTLALVRSSTDVIRALKAAGWMLVRTKGDHYHFKHPDHPGIITVPHPKKDLSIGVLKSIERASRLKLT